MNLAFYLSAAIAILSTLLVITRTNVMHALLYLIVSFLAVAVMFFVLGAPFIAALEVIVYAGAILVLFVFAIMLLNLSPGSKEEENRFMSMRNWVGPTILAAVLLVEVVLLLAGRSLPDTGNLIEPKQVGIALFGPYIIGVELVSILLLASLVGAYHIGQRAIEPEIPRKASITGPQTQPSQQPAEAMPELEKRP